MTRVALRGLVGRKLRTVLTGLAIVLGVALVSGSFVLTDTISKAFDHIFNASYAQTDAVVSGRKIVDYSSGGNATVSPALLRRIRALPGVEAAAGQIIDLDGDSTQAKIVDRHGNAVGGNGNPTFGIGIDPAQPRFNPLRLKDGHWARGPRQVVVDVAVARKEHFVIGDRIGVAADGPVRHFTLVGTATYGGVQSLGGATMAVFDLPTAQALLRKPGYDAIAVAKKPGVSAGALLRELRAVAPPTAQVKTGKAYAGEQKQGVAGFISFLRWFMLAFGAIALFVGAFVIFNTLSITVAQRSREFATLRTLGASRRQVLRSVVAESLAIGVLASAVGLFLGFALAKGLSKLFDVVGVSLPQASTVFALRTVIVALGLGTAITLLAGLIPAIRATRVPPIAAVREGAVISRPRRWTPYAGGALAAVAVGVLSYGLLVSGVGVGGRIVSIAVGTLALFVGVAVLSPRLVPALARIVGRPSAQLGIGGRLARENAVRNPGRTAATAAALMIGLALVTFVAAFANGLTRSNETALRDQLAADYVVTANSIWQKLPYSVAGTIASAPGVRVAASLVTDRARMRGDNVDVYGADPRTIARPYRFHWTEGSDASLTALGRRGAVVRKAFADRYDVNVGNRITLLTAAGRRLRLIVRGVYDPGAFAPMLGSVLVSTAAFRSAFPRPKLALALVQGGGQAKASLERALRGYPDARVRTVDDYVAATSADLKTILNLLYVLLALSGLVSLLGMINTLALAVFERTRELGMLRAIGMTRRQARRMVRHESVVTGLIGAALGIPLGVGLAAIVTRALAPYGLQFSFPVRPVATFVVVAIVSGLLAAILPARRVSRLNVLKALQYQ